MNSSKPVLDIIVTHHDEAFDIGEKFFLMLAMQRDVDFDAFRVILVQDGKEHGIDDLHKAWLEGMPYKVKTVTIPHGGASAARNAGLATSDAEWVMFCDFDDTFTNICSLKLIVNVLGADGIAVGWFETWQEENRHKDFVNVMHENIESTDGKVYRRKMLLDNRVAFRTELKHRYEAQFNGEVFTVVPSHLVKKINMPFAAYMKTLRKGSYNLREECLPEIMNEILTGSMMQAEFVRKTGNRGRFRDAVCDALCDGYFTIQNDPCMITEKNRNAFCRFVKQNAEIINTLDISTMEIAMESSAARMDALVQSMFMTFGTELMPPVAYADVAVQWMRTLDQGITMQGMNTQPAVRHIRPAGNRGKQERIAVYCGTRNTYGNMVTSAKSLLAHTPMDRIYFLTEDDVFPEPLPEIITNINVSGQEYFRKDGPNYKNSWTYMCLMRGAFAKILPQHGKVLSLDIDVVVNENISELFDIDMTDYYLAGVHEPSRQQSDYINFGVVIMNLDRLRRDHMDDRIIAYLNNRQYDCPEQTCFSEVCAGHILLLPADYNYTPHGSITGDAEHPKIIHYAGVKYWKHYAEFRKYAGLQWEEIHR